MQPRSLLRLRQGDLVRLRPARGRRLRERPAGAAVHLPLTRTRRGPDTRRLVAGLGAAPLLFLLYVALGGGAGGGAAWLAVVGLVAVAGAAVLADFVPRAGQGVRDAVGCAPCAAMPAMTTVGAGLLIASVPGSASMALAALAIVVFGLVQRRSSPVVACATR